MSAATEQKRLDQRSRVCLDKEITHIRCNEWFGDVVTENPVTLIGYPADLHGTVCTCCKRRAA